MKDKLSAVFLDGYPVELSGELRPALARILRAGGSRSGGVDVARLDSASDPEGVPLGLYDVIDRTATPTRPIYLRSRPKRPVAASEARSHPGRDRVIDQLGRGPDPRDERPE